MIRDLLEEIDWDKVIASLHLTDHLESPSPPFRSWMGDNTHAHNYAEIAVNLSGDHLYGVNGKAARLTPGATLPIPKGVPHDKWYGAYHAQCIDFWIHILPWGPITMGFVLHDPASELLLQPVPLPIDQGFHNLKYLCELLSERESLKTVEAERKFEFYLLYYLSVLFEKFRKMDFFKKRIDESAIIRGVIKYVNDNLTESLTLNDLSKASGYSPFHFHRMFVKSTGMTPRLFIEKKRIELAREFLMQDQSITSAAFNAGFSSSSQFSQIFKKHLSLTPTMWVQSLRKKR